MVDPNLNTERAVNGFPWQRTGWGVLREDVEEHGWATVDDVGCVHGFHLNVSLLRRSSDFGLFFDVDQLICCGGSLYVMVSVFSIE